MYMPKSAIPVGGTSAPTQPQKSGYMPKSAQLQTNQQAPQNNGYSWDGFLSNLLGSSANFVGNTADAVTHPMQTASNILKLPFGEGEVAASKVFGNKNNYNDGNMQMANAFNQNIANRYGSPQKVADTAYSDPVGALVDASSLLDGGGSLAAKVGDVGKLDKLGQAGKLTQQAGNAINPMNTLNNGAKFIVAPAIQKIGNSVQDYGANLPLGGLRPSPTQLTNFKKTTGIDLGDFMNKNGILADFQNHANNTIEGLQNAYDAIAKNTNVNVPHDGIIKNFQPMIDNFNSSLIPSVKAKADDLQGYLDALKNKYNGNPSVNDVLTERRHIDEVMKSPQYNSLSPEQATLYKNIRDGLKTTLDKATSGQGLNGQGTSEIGKQLSTWHAFKDIADKQVNVGRTSSPLSFRRGASTVVGNALGGLPGALAGYFAEDAAKNPKVIAATSKTLQGAGNVIGNVGKGLSATAANPQMQTLLNLLRTATSYNQNTTKPYGGTQ